MKKIKNRILESIVTSYMHCLKTSPISGEIAEIAYKNYRFVDLSYLEVSLRQFLSFIDRLGSGSKKKRLLFVFEEDLLKIFEDTLSSSGHFYTTDPKYASSFCRNSVYSGLIGGVVFIGSFEDVNYFEKISKPLFFFSSGQPINSDLRVVLNTRYHSSLFLLNSFIAMVLKTSNKLQ